MLHRPVEPARLHGTWPKATDYLSPIEIIIPCIGGDGQLERAKKPSSIRGLNRNCNHDLKNLFKGAAIVASSKPGPFQEFYTALLTKGIRPEMARLTLARKIATIVLMVWKRGACFDAQHLKTTNSMSVSDRVRSISGDFSGGGRGVLETLWFESEPQLIS